MHYTFTYPPTSKKYNMSENMHAEEYEIELDSTDIKITRYTDADDDDGDDITLGDVTESVTGWTVTRTDGDSDAEGDYETAMQAVETAVVCAEFHQSKRFRVEQA